MAEPDRTKLDSLAPDARAILSLILIQGRGYGEIGELLKLDSDRVRDRAHEALAALAPADAARPDAATQARVADYLLGELSVSARVRARSELAASAPAHAWASSLSEALAPLTQTPLPAIPAVESAPADADTAAPAGVHFASVRPADPAPDPPADPAPDQPADPAPDQPVAAAPVKRRRWWLPLAGLVLIAAAGVAIALGSSSTGTAHHATTAGTRSSPTTAARTSGKAAPVAKTIRRLVLSPAGPDRSAFGAAAIVRQHHGLLLLVQGRGLKPNYHDSYAVWLFNTPADSRLLGFVSPAVGAKGTFSSGTSLPDDAVRFRELVVTVETDSQPATPGHAVLQGRLALS